MLLLACKYMHIYAQIYAIGNPALTQRLRIFGWITTSGRWKTSMLKHIWLSKPNRHKTIKSKDK